MIKIGGTEISDIAIGSTSVNKVYLGSDLVWEKGEPDPYAGFTYNMCLTRGTALSAKTGWCVSPYIPTNGALTVRIKYGKTGGNLPSYIMNEYLSGYTYKDYWGTSGDDPRTITLTGKASSLYVRGCFRMSILDDCYIYDVTHGVYLFKGVNVT